MTKSATRLAQAVRLGDCAARVGGDEFIVVLDSISDPEMAIAIASRIGAKLRQPIFHNGHEYPISASIGISIYPDHAENRFGLVGLADQARYATNQNGNGAVRMHKPCPDKSSATARPALSGESINGGRLESTSSSARDFRLSRREERR